jgi:hypothetical protein
VKCASTLERREWIQWIDFVGLLSQLDRLTNSADSFEVLSAQSKAIRVTRCKLLQSVGQLLCVHEVSNHPRQMELCNHGGHVMRI